VSSVREQVVEGAVLALNAGAPPAPFARSRAAEVSDADMPIGILYPVRDVPQMPFTGERVVRSLVTRRRLSIACELRALGTPSVRPDQAVDPLYAWLVATLVGNTIGGLVQQWEEGESTFQYGLGDKPICLLSVEMVAVYQTLTANAELVK